MGKTANNNQIKQFTDATGCKDRNKAKKYLEDNDCDVNKAVNSYLDTGESSSPGDSAQAFFDKYKAKGEEVMDQEGIVNFLQDWGVEFTDPLICVFSYLANAKEMGIYTCDEFKTACNALGVTNIDQLKGKNSHMKTTYLDDKKNFIQVYKHCFAHMASVSPDQKTVPIEMAVQLLEVILKGRYPYSAELIEFLPTYGE